MKVFDKLQSIGKTLMLPVAVLPAAAILLRFGSPDLLNISLLAKAGGAECALATYGVEEKVDLTPEEQDPTKKQYIKKVTPLDDWIAEQKAAQG